MSRVSQLGLFFPSIARGHGTTHKGCNHPKCKNGPDSSHYLNLDDKISDAIHTYSKNHKKKERNLLDYD